jgi:type VI secretion system secreted protein VgrG
VDDDAKKHNQNLPGMGGVYNTVNLHLYHYAGNNPVKYTDPDGKLLCTPLTIAAGAVIGAVAGVIVQAGYDMLINHNISSLGVYTGAFVGGATTGAILTATGNAYAAGAAGGFVSSTVSQAVDGNFDPIAIAISTGAGAATGAIPGSRIPGISIGRGSMAAVEKQMVTKLANKTISTVSASTAMKIATARAANGALVEGTVVAPLLIQGASNMTKSSGGSSPSALQASNAVIKSNSVPPPENNGVHNRGY